MDTFHSPGMRIAHSCQVCRNLVQGRGIVDGRRHAVLDAVGDLLDGAANDLARTGLRQPLHYNRHLEEGYRADSLTHHTHQFSLDFVMWTIDTGLEHDEPQGNLSFDLVGDSDDRA